MGKGKWKEKMTAQAVVVPRKVPKWPRKQMPLFASHKQFTVEKEPLEKFLNLLVVPSEVISSILFSLSEYRGDIQKALCFITKEEKRRLVSRCYSNITEVLLSAIRISDLETIELALRFGANIASAKDSINSIFIDSVYDDQITQAEISLKFGADMNSNGKYGDFNCSMLIIATKNYSPQMVELLLDYGANREYRTPTKKSGLDYAIALEEETELKLENKIQLISTLQTYFPDRLWPINQADICRFLL